MPRKYQIIFRKDHSQRFTAQEKAPKDVAEILEKHGYSPLEIGLREYQRAVFRIPVLMFSLLACFLKIERNAQLFFQYPFTKYVQFFFWLFRLKKIRLTVLIHDIESLRYNGKIAVEEINCLAHFDEVIALTEAMKSLLIEKGLNKSNIKVMNIWDYLVKVDFDNSIQSFGYKIGFAGNFDKSTFLTQLNSITTENLAFVLYGSQATSSNIFSEKVTYGGKFSPDDISVLEANWGLVWDGESIETCNGNFGEYLKINTSHKIGLYLAKGIPVIVWKQSAVADYILQHNLGITVESLHDVESRISNIGEEGYAEILKNVSVFSKKVRKGEMLGCIIE